MIEIDFIKFFHYLKRRWILFVSIIFTCVAAGIVLSFFIPKVYRTQVVLIPNSLASETSIPSVSLPGIPQFLNNPSTSSSESLLFSIINSRSFLMSLSDLHIKTQSSEQTSVKSFLEFDTLTNLNINSYLSKMKKLVQFEQGGKDNGYREYEYILTIQGTDPLFIYHLATELVPYLDSTWMAFLTAKLDRDIQEVLVKSEHAKTALNEAENSLVTFQNRNYSILEGKPAPALTQKLQELNRDVKVLESKFLLVYDKLQSLELEKLSISPKMTILDSAFIPARHFSPQRKLIVILTFFGACSLLLLIFFCLFVLNENRNSQA